jgi:hypothetical protein
MPYLEEPVQSVSIGHKVRVTAKAKQCGHFLLFLSHCSGQQRWTLGCPFAIIVPVPLSPTEFSGTSFYAAASGDEADEGQVHQRSDRSTQKVQFLESTALKLPVWAMAPARTFLQLSLGP